jgi:hypothetical protein
MMRCRFLIGWKFDLGRIFKVRIRSRSPKNARRTREPVLAVRAHNHHAAPGRLPSAHQRLGGFIMRRNRMFALPLMLMAFLALPTFQAPLSAQAPTFTVLYSFTGGPDGANPTTATMVRDAHGNLYGTTQFGADVNCNVSLHPGCGTVFELHTSRKLTALHTFQGGSLGLASSGLVMDGKGNLYGTAGGGEATTHASGGWTYRKPVLASGRAWDQGGIHPQH